MLFHSGHTYSKIDTGCDHQTANLTKLRVLPHLAGGSEKFWLLVRDRWVARRRSRHTTARRRATYANPK